MITVRSTNSVVKSLQLAAALKAPEMSHAVDIAASETEATGQGSVATSLTHSLDLSLSFISRSPWVVAALGQEPDSEGATGMTERMTMQRERSISARFADASAIHSASDEGMGLLQDGAVDQGLGFVDGQGQEHELSGGDGSSRFSTFRQTCFNAVNVLLGVGLLSLPYAMRLCGWLGLAILILLSALTCHTAKLLGEIQEYVPDQKLREGPHAYSILGFHDMAFLVFGVVGKVCISVLFIAETFGFCCVFLIIEGENLAHQLQDTAAFSGWTKNNFICLSALIFLPSCLLRNLSWLSYFSAVGVLSSVSLVAGVVVTGLMDTVPPNTDVCKPPSCTGSLYSPSETDAAHTDNLLQILGLVMVGYSGHAVFPTLRNDMVDKSAYPRMVNATYAITCSAYVTMACCGYLMFGNAAQPEVTMDMNTEFLVSRGIVWLVILNPLTKFALDLAPVAQSLEGCLVLSWGLSEQSLTFVLLSCALRSALVCLALAIVLAAPSFATVLGVMGSLSCFTMSVSFPCWCFARLFWHDLGLVARIVNVSGAVFGTICAVLGTVAALRVA